MATYVKLNEKVEGPFTDEEIRDHFNDGRIMLDTPAWREGQQAWQTVGDYFTDLVAVPALSGDSFDEKAEIQDTLAWINRMQEAFNPPPPNQTDAIERLEALAAPLMARMENRLGSNARASTNYYAHRTVTLAIQRLRLDVLDGAALNQRGETYLAQVAAYLGLIVLSNWRRRGLTIEGRVEFEPGSESNGLVFSASRVRDGVEETYGHDFLKDTREVLLRPKQMFPYMRDRLYSIESLTMPSPESLYMFGVAFMSSPQATGNWPQGTAVGCLEEDFEAARQLIVDDLHSDCGIPLEHEGFRKLSFWIVFPPYGWDMNDAHDYNIMTLLSQISVRKVVTADESIQYLRSLLKCQAMEIRLLAARCLMIFRIPPHDQDESSHYRQALEFRDYPAAAECMAKYQCEYEKVDRTDAWSVATEAERHQWVKDVLPILSHRTIAESDPDYQEMEQNPSKTLEEGIEKLETLMDRYPQDWVLKALHASQLLQGPDLDRGEKIMRELIQDPPDCFEAHSRFGTFLKYQKRTDEALAVYEDALRYWPWSSQATDACFWMLTDGMTQ